MLPLLITPSFSHRMNISTGTSTASNTAGMVAVITSSVSGGNNSETYWVDGSNIFPPTRVDTIQARRTNGFRRAFIIANTFKEGLPDEKNLPLEKSKSKITLTSWISWMRSYMVDKGMNAFFCIYNT